MTIRGASSSSARNSGRTLVKPRAASNVASTPSLAPQAHASFVISGSATDRMIGAIGAWYSASPRACSNSSSPRLDTGRQPARAGERPRPHVIARITLVQRDSGPDRDLISHDDRQREVLRVGVRQLRGGHGGWDHHCPGMSLRQAVPVIQVEHVCKHAVRPGRAHGAGPTSVEECDGVVTGVHRRGMVGSYPRRRGRAPRDANRGEVGEQERRPISRPWPDAPRGSAHG